MVKSSQKPSTNAARPSVGAVNPGDQLEGRRGEEGSNPSLVNLDEAIQWLDQDPAHNLAAGIYAAELRPRAGRLHPGGEHELMAAAVEQARETLEQMQPRDPLEKILITQCLWAHGRLAHLTLLANSQADPKGLQVIHELCDAAANSLRRLILGLAEYRRPSRPGDHVTAIQANIAHQQVVQNRPRVGRRKKRKT